MKRCSSLLLCILLLLSAAVTVFADGEDGISGSRPAPSVSYREWSGLFTECEQAGLGSLLTRGELFAVLCRAANAEGAVNEAPFADVDSAAWYAPGAKWARDMGFYADPSGCFYPGETVSRESLCFTLRLVANTLGWTLDPINEWFPFRDGGYFSSDLWRDAAAAVQMAGILTEDADGYFHPGEGISVAEWEGVVLRLLEASTSSSPSFPGMPTSTVAESEAVADSWFDDVCFIGHSQVVGMQKYFKLDNADYFAVIGHTAKAVVDYEDYELPQGGWGSLRKGLENNTYNKIYIMLGINDCSDREDRIEEFKAPMRTILDLVKETQPNAVIYMISVLPVGDYNPDPYIYNLENVTLYSQAVKSLAREYGVEYLDLFRLMAEKDGSLSAAYDAGDGIHIQAAMYEPIKSYLKTHTGGY